MNKPRSPEQAQALLARETRWRLGAVPHELAGRAVPPGYRLIDQGRFLLRCESGLGYLYQPGDGITIERPGGVVLEEEELWLKGSVHAAVASLNGFLPIHASAVAHQGRVVAFTGPSGAGKSTLVAGLGRHGLPLFCDDTLVIDLGDPARLICMPGHKRLKLLDDALILTGAEAGGPVGADTGKHYAASPAGDVTEPLPLDTLVFLEEGPDPAWIEVRGAERFARLEDDHYTQEIFLEANRPDRAALFALRARIAGAVKMARLVRPRSSTGFAASLEQAARAIIERTATR